MKRSVAAIPFLAMTFRVKAMKSSMVILLIAWQADVQWPAVPALLSTDNGRGARPARCGVPLCISWSGRVNVR